MSERFLPRLRGRYENMMGTGMHRMCLKGSSIALLLAGAVMATGTGVAGYGSVAIAGTLFALMGVGALVHSMGMCKQCALNEMPKKR